MSRSNEIRALVGKIGRAAAEAVGRYCRITGEKADSIQERVIQMYLFDHLGDEYPMVPELPVGRIWERRELNSPKVALPDELQRISDWRVDLVLLAGGEIPAEQRHVEGLIELKRWIPSSDDRSKLEMLRRHLPLCQFGLRLTLVDVDVDNPWIEDLRKASSGAAHHFEAFAIKDARTIRNRACSIVAQASF